MLKIQNERGFTLIELLVVVAIIAILSAVVLSNLGASRGKSANGAIKTSFAQMRSQAALYLLTNDNFGTAAASNNCSLASAVFSDPKFIQMISNAQNASGGGNVAICSNTTGSNGSWAVSIKLNATENGKDYVCTDATGIIKTYVSSPGSVTVCP